MTKSNVGPITAFALALFIVAFTPARASANAELIMVDQKNCHWCRKWDAEIGVSYDTTPVGQIAPLRRIDLHERKPDDLSHINLGRATPVFILMEDGHEIGRVRGYPGPETFWMLLKEQLMKLPSPQQQSAPPSPKRTAYSLSRK